MTITIRPSDLIERFVWDKYVHFCLHGVPKATVAEMVQADEEFIMKEEDAFVIGLTGVIYTNDIAYKFKQHVKELIENKSFEFEKRLHMNKQLLLDNVRAFLRKVPANYQSSDPAFNIGISGLDTLHELFRINVENLQTVTVQDWQCVRSGQVKKIINRIC